ncbi:hypothetical protein A6B43_03030 [Vespertiliibacter pulmonis]|uniref:EpsG-like putative glucosyltransferase n=2 Tax=Vespertiliibacter pulmonis TaxID=1443036 RepID=A0A3N4WBR4_9PAST|nr:hypothetical protein A6B43_03030 [Vespertiliibacter pulmonis]RPE82704.1 EpsG-like putative glucosyltransferase [Vespertiliibacter pulmonis]
MIPYDTMDIVRHYDMFLTFKDIPVSDVYEYGRNVDYIFSLYSWLIINIGLPKEFIPFSTTFFSYILYFLSFYKIINTFFNKDISSISFKLLTVIGFFLLINEIKFMDTANGLRNACAFSLFTYAMSNYVIRGGKIYFLCLSAFSICIHASAALLLLPFLVSLILKGRVPKGIILISYLILIIGASGLFYSIIELLEPILRSNNLYYPSYFDPDGVWGAGYYENANLNTIVFEKYIKPLPYYVAGIYFIFVNKYASKKMASFLIVLFFCIACLSVSRTIFDRLNNIFVILFILFLVMELCQKKFTILKKIFIFIFISSSIFMSLGSLYKYRDIYWPSWNKILYTPLPVLFLTNEILPDNYIIRNSGE